jgi:hypothetical protein
MTRRLLAAAVVVLAAGCGDSPSAPVQAPSGAPRTSTGVVSRVEVTPSPASVGVGQSVQLTARAYDANNVQISGKTATWSSSNPSVASVGASGLLTGNAGGSATIYAGIDGVYGSVPVSVTTSTYSVAISGPEFVTTEGANTWTAVYTGNPGSRYTEWRINWLGDQSDEFVPIDTGDTLTLNISSCDPDFELMVVVQSATLGTRQDQLFVFNMSSGSFCW